MKVIIPRASLKWTSGVLFAAGLSLLGYCGYVSFDTWMFQSRERGRFEAAVSETHQARLASISIQKAAPALPEGLIGQIDIPRLNVSVMVMEGTSDATLQRAVGHIEGTALPGKTGNVALSGHRDTFFRPLRNIRRNDVITVTTLKGKFKYRVISTRIVSPTEMSVLDAGKTESLTLVTCYPFYFIGPAPDRFIVRAERII